MGGSAGPAGRRVLPRAAWAACAALVLVVGGCGPGKLRPIASEWEFNQQVLKADRPVVVYFTKGGCAWCMFLDSCMDQLYEEYGDRVTFLRFELMSFWSKITCEPIWKGYRIARFPTVVLFVNGKEKYRWVTNYSGDAYRPVLDEVGRHQAERPPGRTPAASRGRRARPRTAGVKLRIALAVARPRAKLSGRGLTWSWAPGASRPKDWRAG